MSETFTNYYENGISQINSNDFDYIEALNFLNNPNNFRPFSEGLIELLERNVSSITFHNNGDRTDYLYKKLLSINSTITKSTIAGWFSGKRRPKLVSNSRLLMYEVCFALELPISEVFWFFHHVYFDRSFNCHMIDEAVYYYCFLHHLTYHDAKSFLAKIMETPEKESMDSELIYTQAIRKRIDSFSSSEELISFLSDNKSSFNKWNVSAKDKIADLLSHICGKEGDKRIIKESQKNGFISSYVIRNCGLIIQECYSYYGDEFTEYISGKNITSINFMLDMILNTSFGIQKTAEIPEIVKSNFPSKKVFSDILNKSDTLTSYDSIKKILIFLKFYEFWCQAKLYDSYSEYKPEELYEIFIDETNELLFSCGYENLYAGNPYDWLFMRSAKASEPLNFLRDSIGSLTDIEDESE